MPHSDDVMSVKLKVCVWVCLCACLLVCVRVSVCVSVPVCGSPSHSCNLRLCPLPLPSPSLPPQGSLQFGSCGFSSSGLSELPYYPPPSPALKVSLTPPRPSSPHLTPPHPSPPLLHLPHPISLLWSIDVTAWSQPHLHPPPPCPATSTFGQLTGWLMTSLTTRVGPAWPSGCGQSVLYLSV